MRKILLVLILAIAVSSFCLVSPLHAAKAKSSEVITNVHLEEVNGYLDGKDASQSFTVYCDNKSQDVEFTQPSDADFWVKVLGRNDNYLDDFQLSEGEIIQLSGGGRFTLVVHSEDGEGAWTAKPVIEEKTEE